MKDIAVIGAVAAVGILYACGQSEGSGTVPE
jgi:hypothetical protein